MTMVSDTLLVIYSVSLLVVVIALFLNVTGAILLWKIERVKTNQRTILLNLSICEACLSAFLIVHLFMKLQIFGRDKKYFQIMESANLLCYLECYFTIIMMTIDRFIGTKFPLRHQDLFSKRRLTKVLALTWILSLVAGILLAAMYERVRQAIRDSYLFTLMDTLSLSCIGIAYGYIMYIVRTRKLPTTATARRSRGSKQLIKMTAIIAFTFILFIVIPDFALAFIGKEISTEIEGILLFGTYLVLVADPITYLLIRKKLRKSFLKIFCCRGCRQGSIEHQQATTISYGCNSTIYETKM